MTISPISYLATPLPTPDSTPPIGTPRTHHNSTRSSLPSMLDSRAIFGGQSEATFDPRAQMPHLAAAAVCTAPTATSTLKHESHIDVSQTLETTAPPTNPDAARTVTLHLLPTDSENYIQCFAGTVFQQWLGMTIGASSLRCIMRIAASHWRLYNLGMAFATWAKHPNHNLGGLSNTSSPHLVGCAAYDIWTARGPHCRVFRHWQTETEYIVSAMCKQRQAL